MAFKKTIGKIHLWLGLGSGLVVFILGLTGCLYVFIDELKPLVYQSRMYVSVPTDAHRLPLQLLQENAQKVLGPAYPLLGAEIPTHADRTVSFRAVEVDGEAFPYTNYMKHYYRVYVNPYTGQVVKMENTKWEFFNVVVNLHVNLLLGHKVGGQVVAWSVVVFVVMLISGLILWWPKNKNAAKQRFWFKWKEGLKWKRKNYDLHNVLGFYAMVVLLVIALTGLVWSFEWFSNSVQWLANGGKTHERPKSLVSDTTHQGAYSLNSIVAKALLKCPEASTLYVSIPRDVKSPVYVYAQRAGANYKSTQLQYDQHTEALLAFKSFEQMNNGERINAMNYDLHVGSIAGLPGKILAFCASLIAASLPVTGFLIWLGRKKKAQKEKKKGKKMFKLKTFKSAV
jgi:uncharacterized iron-regulated membrane protein